MLLELDPNSAETQYNVGFVATWSEMNWEKGEQAWIRTLELNPNHAECRMYYAHLLMGLRRNEEAVTQARIGLKLDPMNPLIQGLYAVVMEFAGDFESAISHFQEALAIDPNFFFATINMAQAYFFAGDFEHWFPLWNKITCWEDEVKTRFRDVYYESGWSAAIEELFRLNEIYGTSDCHLGPLNKMDWYMKMNRYEKAIDCMEEIYEMDPRRITYVATNRFGYEQLKSYPRYVEILRKLNLPLPDKED
jgi:tetratricopeptide (TPR) repeat protein